MIRTILSATLIAFGTAVFVPRSAAAQIQTIVTDHFRIHFQESARGTARRVAETAEEVFAPMAATYDYYDDYSPIHIIVVDTSDMLGNAWASYYHNIIFVWATALDSELRGTYDHIKHLIPHEMAHIMTLNKARKKWPFHFALLQVTRFDANPDITFNFPLYHLNAPRWWAEGIAQYNTQHFGFDRWDTHRDMRLRMAALEDDLLAYEEMGSVGMRDGGYYGDMVYTQGYGLLLYIQDQYGREKVEELTYHTGTLSFDPTIRRVLGISADQLYEDWVRFLEEHYGQLAAEIRSQALFEGDPLRELNEGYMEYYPAYSPDGGKLAYITSEKLDYPFPYLKIYDFETGKKKKLKDFVDTRISWSPDSKEIVFVRNKGGFNDLYLYNLEEDKEHRISARLRAKDPAFSPDGKRIVFVHNEDGTNNLGLIDRDGGNLVYLTNHNDATQYWAPRFSPDGQWLLFSVFRGEDRDIAMMRADSPTRPKSYGLRKREEVPDSLQVFPDSLAFPDPDTSGFRALLASRADERDPYWLPDGSGFVFASDRTGIFNLYHYELESGQVEQLTNVLGGAFTPTVSSEGRVTYAGYHASDHSLYEFELGAYQKEALFERVALRDYQSVFQAPKLSEEYTVGRYGGRKVLNYVPILSVGPTFLGDEFGLNQASAGLQFTTGEQLGGQELTAWGVLGKNFRADTDLNTDFGLYYERSLRPMVGNSRTFNPSFYIGLRRREVDSVSKNRFPSARIDTFAEPTTFFLPVDASSSMLIPNIVESHEISVISREDHFKDVFETISLGVNLPLTRRQRLSFQYLRRNYDENWQLQRFRSQSKVFLLQEVGPGDTVNISLADSLISTDDLLVSEEDPLDFYSGLDFYTSHDLSVFWTYQKTTPKAHSRINPTGRSMVLAYRYMLPTLADSLANQTSPDGVPRDPLGPAKRRLRVNEYIGRYEERIGLPFDNTLSLEVLGAYRNLQLKNFVPGEGGQFEGVYYWPLRYYLGGRNFLSGYPYFVRRGSKLLYGRVSYTFPVYQRLRSSFFNFHFAHLYAELFAEAGAMGNFNKVNFKPFDTDHFLFEGFTAKHFLSDVGGELRLRLFNFYTYPMTAFFQVARPLNRDRELGPRLREWEQQQARLDPSQRDPEDEGPQPVDKWRFYFGLGF